MSQIKLIYFIIAIVCAQTLSAQNYLFFHYESSHQQYFKFHSGANKKMLYVNMDRNDIVFNTLFEINESTKKLIIPQSGFYELSGFYRFNLNTGNINGTRAGINFGFVQIKSGIEEYIAGTRISYTNKTQDQFLDVHIYPTIIYLDEGVVIAPVLSTGLLDKPIVNAEIGCPKSDKNCISFKWSLKKISDEASQQKYF